MLSSSTLVALRNEVYMPKSYHHGDLRAALLEATLGMIANDETHLIGFRELARRLDVSRTAPYRHFESIEVLLSVVAEDGYQKFIERLEVVTGNKLLSNRERFMELGIAYINFAIDNPAHYRLLFDQRFFEEGKFEGVQQSAAKAFGLLLQTSSCCLAESASPQEKANVAHLAWACVHGISSLLMNGQLKHVKDRQKFIRQSCEKLLLLGDI